MARKVEDVLNYQKIERNPQQKIVIRKEVIESPDGFETLMKGSVTTMGRESWEEAMHKISDGSPMPVTSCEMETNADSSVDSSHSIKVEDIPFKEAFNNDNASTAMTLRDRNPQIEEPQEEPLDLSNKTLLRKLKRPVAFSMLKRYDSAEKLQNENVRISSNSDKGLRTVQADLHTRGTFGTYKVKLLYKARSRTNPYPVTIPSQVDIPGIGLVQGLFVPGYPETIYKTDDCIEISLTEPSERKEEDQRYLYSAESMHPIGLDHGYHHPAVSSTASSHASLPPDPNGSRLNMPSATFNSRQALIPLTSSDYYQTYPPSTPDVSQISTDNKTLRSLTESSNPLTPNCHQPETTDVDVQISRCTNPLFAVNSEQHSSICHSEESQVTMDTGNSICLPNIPCLHDNVNDWGNTEHEAVKKLLNKKIKHRKEAPD